MASAMVVSGIEELAARVGKRAGPTNWRSVSQDLIDRFAVAGVNYGWTRIRFPTRGESCHSDLS